MTSTIARILRNDPHAKVRWVDDIRLSASSADGRSVVLDVTPLDGAHLVLLMTAERYYASLGDQMVDALPSLRPALLN